MLLQSREIVKATYCTECMIYEVVEGLSAVVYANVLQHELTVHGHNRSNTSPISNPINPVQTTTFLSEGDMQRHLKGYTQVDTLPVIA